MSHDSFYPAIYFSENNKYADKVEKKAEEAPPPVIAPVEFVHAPVQSLPPKHVEGTAGKPVKVEVNYYPMNVDKVISEAFHYCAKFTPPGPKKLTKLALELVKQKRFNKIAYGFDGAATIYTNKKLESDIVDEEVDVNPDGTRIVKFKVSITFAATVDLEIMKE